LGGEVSASVILLFRSSSKILITRSFYLISEGFLLA